MDSTAAATCVPWIEAGCADPGGYRLGAAIRSGLPVRVAPFDTSRHSNPNVAVFAASGHGKSFAIGTLVLEAAVAGVNSVIIDPEGEYRGLIAALGGRYLELAPGTDAAVNVFEGAGDDPEEAIAAVVVDSSPCSAAINSATSSAPSSMRRRERPYSVRRSNSARRSSRTASRHSRSRPDRLPWWCVASAPVGSARSSIDRRRSPLIPASCAISLREMPPEHVAAATLIVARWLWELVRRDGRRRHIVFDEVGALCAHRPLRDLLVQLARRCRKYNASLVVATQNAQDLLGTDEGSVIATNCAVVLLGGHRAAETARMERAFGLTEAQRGFLESASRGEFLLIAGDRRVAMRIEVPELHRAILTGETRSA